MSLARFVAMIEKFNEAHKQAIRDMGFAEFIELQVTELLGVLCKWLLHDFDPYLVTMYIAPKKKIEITPMNVHLILALSLAATYNVTKLGSKLSRSHLQKSPGVFIEMVLLFSTMPGRPFLVQRLSESTFASPAAFILGQKAVLTFCIANQLSIYAIMYTHGCARHQNRATKTLIGISNKST
ncbi:hypothetical protein Cgig2_018976 [Carnegiea gigantea]|uniref:Uncharacterized protein n=1 Tax=Carnegiea gigantea TaxID=171969 RepID=A0A9Q1QAL0_9CARY|nr:hypothetical protein Cgig2_018976 [Carnegiea gigantea]